MILNKAQWILNDLNELLDEMVFLMFDITGVIFVCNKLLVSISSNQRVYFVQSPENILQLGCCSVSRLQLASCLVVATFPVSSVANITKAHLWHTNETAWITI